MVKIKYYKSKYIDQATKIIHKFSKKNKIPINITICLDYTETDAGRYEWGDILYINPSNCWQISNLVGHPEDGSLPAVILHEFSHFLDHKFKIKKQYISIITADKTKRLRVSNYSKTNLTEEVAELIQVYLVNPYIIKKVNLYLYNWLKKMFKSPVPCSEVQFKKYESLWKPKFKQRFYNKFKNVNFYETK